MKTSARNALRGVVTAIAADRLNAEVAVEVAEGSTIYAVVTNESVHALNLHVGREAVVLIKASFVMIAAGAEPPVLSARNCLSGVVTRCETSAVNAEVVLDIGGGKTIAASITARSVEALGLAPGKPACALFDGSHVIVAID